jgi:hypothetical protein
VRCVAPEAAARHQRRTVRLRERTLSIRGAECRARRRNRGVRLAARLHRGVPPSHTKAPVPRVLCSLAPVALIHHAAGLRASRAGSAFKRHHSFASAVPSPFGLRITGRSSGRPTAAAYLQRYAPAMEQVKGGSMLGLSCCAGTAANSVHRVPPVAAAHHQRCAVRSREGALSLRGARCRARRRNLGARLASRCAVAHLQSHTKAPVPRVLCPRATVAFIHHAAGLCASRAGSAFKGHHSSASEVPSSFGLRITGRSSGRPTAAAYLQR